MGLFQDDLKYSGRVSQWLTNIPTPVPIERLKIELSQILDDCRGRSSHGSYLTTYAKIRIDHSNSQSSR